MQWERAHGLYEASFHQGEAGQSALFSNNGDLEETASDRSPQSLPAPVRPALGARHPGLTVSTAANLLNAHTGAVTYDAKLLDNASVCTVLFEADGHEVRKARKK